MISPRYVRALASAVLLALAIARVPADFAHARPGSNGLATGTAQGPTELEPLARFQLVIRRIIIHDDRDWGSGDISINVVVWSRDLACRGGACIRELVE